ncbi:E3 ubiquitin-protein ligase XIAP-like isoform X2 [Anneissia japonica]|uniref:E3 ubiquitin-protein ligase XIAP-like isoform X2 n=1 Tax=Anneissia japonica TaxID=1529436 RepID=UPI00142566E1|nr:E3 ubiquitin-protein ligase XIAP-like isoform X2 [Anneissia japonica]
MMTAENSHSKVRSLLSYAKSLDDYAIEADCMGFQQSHSLAPDTDLYDVVDDVDAGLTSLHSVDGIAVITLGATASASNLCSNERKNRHHGTERNLSAEVDRLATFKKWPHSSPMNPSTLSRAGFFYTGSDDMVKCFSCNGKIKDWEFGDSAVGEHKRFFPKCKFIQGKDQQNQTMLQNQASSLQTVPVAKGQSSKEDDNFNPKKDSFTIDKTKIPGKLNSEYRRLLTFQNWPRTNPLQPRTLAKAGFYYTQTRDIVKCFACTGEISTGKVMDVPMIQHTMLFPECPFVQGEDVGNEKLTTTDVMNAQHAVVLREPSTKLSPMRNESKNKSRVSQTAKMIDQRASMRSQSASNAPEASPLAGFFHTEGNTGFYYEGIYSIHNEEELSSLPLEDAIKTRMESKIVHYLVIMGFPLRKIRRIIERQLRTRNVNSLNTIQSLIDALLVESDEPRDNITSANTMNGKLEAVLPASILDDKWTCKIRVDNEINVLLTPCGHLVACEQCARLIQICPICRLPIKTLIKICLS